MISPLEEPSVSKHPTCDTHKGWSSFEGHTKPRGFRFGVFLKIQSRLQHWTFRLGRMQMNNFWLSGRLLGVLLSCECEGRTNVFIREPTLSHPGGFFLPLLFVTFFLRSPDHGSNGSRWSSRLTPGWQQPYAARKRPDLGCWGGPSFAGEKRGAGCSDRADGKGDGGMNENECSERPVHTTNVNYKIILILPILWE